MNSNIITLTNEIVDPTDEMMFHAVQASGQSEYRRGIPANPRKCCGKNVMSTPANITANWAFSHFGFIVSAANNGNH